MPDESVKMSFKVDGVSKPALDEPRGMLVGGFDDCVDEIAGDANANGTALLTKEVTAGQTLILMQCDLAVKAAAISTILLVESDTNGVGGTEVLKRFADIPSQNSISLGDGKVPVLIIKNTGTSSKYLVIYVPEKRLSLVGNNAVTQWFAASMQGIIE